MATREELLAQLEELDKAAAATEAERHPYGGLLDGLRDHRVSLPALADLLTDLIDRAYPAKDDKAPVVESAPPVDPKTSKGGKS